MQSLKSIFNRLKKGAQRRCSTIRSDWGQNHQFDVGFLDPYKSEVINLMVGAPGPHLLIRCCEILKTATHHRMKYESENNAVLFQYGATVGGKEIRVKVAEQLTKNYNNFVHPSDLIITNGGSIGLNLILSTLIDMSGVVFVDDLTFMIALNSIRQYTNMTIVPVPLTETGPDIGAFEALIAKHTFKPKSKKLFWGMYFTTSIFHNPTGKVFSSNTCNELSKLARQHDFLIACDDVFSLLNYSAELPKRLYAYDNITDPDYKGNVISNGSFSQILAPGVRMGWMECPPRCVQILRVSGFLVSGGCLNNYTSGIVASLMELGLFENHLKFYVENYKRNMHAACKILKENLPPGCTFHAPGGGYFIWIELPNKIDGHDFKKFSMQKYKVVTIVGDIFSFEKKYKNCLRISITFYELETLIKGVTLLCEALNAFLSKV